MCERLEEHDAVCLAARWHAEDRRPIVVRGDLVDRHAADDLAVRKVELGRGSRRSSASARGCDASTRSKAAGQAPARPSRSHLRADEQDPLTRVANPAPGSSPFGPPAAFRPARTQATCASGIPYSSTRQRRVASLIVKTMLGVPRRSHVSRLIHRGGNRSLARQAGKAAGTGARHGLCTRSAERREGCPSNRDCVCSVKTYSRRERRSASRRSQPVEIVRRPDQTATRAVHLLAPEHEQPRELLAARTRAASSLNTGPSSCISSSTSTTSKS